MCKQVINTNTKWFEKIKILSGAFYGLVNVASGKLLHLCLLLFYFIILVDAIAMHF